MLVTKKAPDFTAKAVLADGQIVENFNLYENIGEKGAILFFWPLDFTFVCPSEIIAFSKEGSVAQSVEQRIENPCVDSSILSRATTLKKYHKIIFK